MELRILPFSSRGEMFKRFSSRGEMKARFTMIVKIKKKIIKCISNKRISIKATTFPRNNQKIPYFCDVLNQVIYRSMKANFRQVLKIAASK